MNKLDESLLAPIPPFRRLERAQVRAILDVATPRRHDAGTAIFEEGTPAARFFLLLDGTVRVMRTTAGGEQVVVLHVPSGNLIGIAMAMGKRAYPATATAAGECLTLSWPSTLWPRFVSDYEGFATETYRSVGERLGEMSTRIIEMATQQVEQRVANALLRLVEQAGVKAEEGVLIDLPLTRQDIAEIAGTTLHTVSRLLSAWERNGVTASGRKRVVVTNPHRLALIGAGRG